ncbi:MAG: hypothetical protein KDC99_09190 [Cyclobacteriaceae bacterium]|nr:hypothetical protein [Cyclobacteriaceae bacterium]
MATTRSLLLFCVVTVLFGSCSEEQPDRLVLAPPTNIEISKGLFADRIALRWSSVANADKYRLHKFDSTLGDYELLDETADTLYSDEFTGTPGKKVFYKIQAFNSPELTSEFSKPEYGFLAETKSLALGVPPGLTASKGNYKDKIQLSWYSVVGASGYRLHKLDANLGDYELLIETADTLFSDESTGIPGKKVFYKIQAFNSPELTSEFSKPEYGFLAETKPIKLGIPHGLMASKGNYENKVQLSWYSVVGASSYRVHKFDQGLGDYLPYKTLADTAYTDIVGNGMSEKLYYKVQAYNSAELFSELSEADFGFTNVSPVFTLDKPINFQVSKGAFGTQIKLEWTAIPGVSNYQIFKFNSASDSYELLAQTDQATFADAGSDLTPYEKIFYKVRSYHSESEVSGFSEVDFGYISGKNYDFISEFGSEGTNDGQFLFPEHLALDYQSNIYVSDPNRNVVQKFSNDGDFLTVYYSTFSPRGLVFPATDKAVIARSGDNIIRVMNSTTTALIKEWGSSGSGNGQFAYFRQICLDDENNLYVVDTGNSRIQKFDLDGNFLLKWGMPAGHSGNGAFKNVWGVTYFKGYIVVSSESIIQVFTKTGEFQYQVDMGTTCYDITHDDEHIYIACGSYIAKTDETLDVIEKIGEGDFSTVTSVVVDPNQRLYATSVYTRKIRIYQKN